MNHPFLKFFALTIPLLPACKPTSMSSCLSTSSEVLPLAQTHSITQGGYIQFGDKACNATFDIIEVNAETLRLRAYSARHCRFENGIENAKPLVHLFLPQSSANSAGYVKNINVREDFSERAAALRNQLLKLGVPFEVEAQFLQALKIPTHAGYDAFEPQTNAQSQPTLTGDTNQLVCLNENLVPKLPLSAQSLADICWSALDIGQYDLEIRRSENKPNVFNLLSRQLAEKKKLTENYLARNPNLAKFAAAQKLFISKVQADLRYYSYARIAYLLNFDHCKANPSETGPSTQLCKLQPSLIELAGRHLVESDLSGIKVSVFDKLASESSLEPAALSFDQLQSGKRISIDKSVSNFYSTAEQLAQKSSTGMYSVFKETVAARLDSLISGLRQSSAEPDKSQLSANFIVSTNVQFRENQELGTPSFAQFPLNAISKNAQIIKVATDNSTLKAIDQSIHGVTQYGALRIGVPFGDLRVGFGKTDSGSLLTLGGLAPLMVLNTVNDEGVSGGASILALPEAESEKIIPSDSMNAESKESNKNSSKSKTPTAISCR